MGKKKVQRSPKNTSSVYFSEGDISFDTSKNNATTNKKSSTEKTDITLSNQGLEDIKRTRFAKPVRSYGSTKTIEVSEYYTMKFCLNILGKNLNTRCVTEAGNLKTIKAFLLTLMFMQFFANCHFILLEEHLAEGHHLHIPVVLL